MGYINTRLTKGDKVEDMLEGKLEDLDMWIKRVERSNKPLFIPPELYYDVKVTVEDALLFDFNMIIEEFPFFQQATPEI